MHNLYVLAPVGFSASADTVSIQTDKPITFEFKVPFTTDSMSSKDEPIVLVSADRKPIEIKNWSIELDEVAQLSKMTITLDNNSEKLPDVFEVSVTFKGHKHEHTVVPKMGEPMFCIEIFRLPLFSFLVNGFDHTIH